MIPCLINDLMEAEVNEIEREFSAHEEVLCLRYLFDWNSSTIGLYHKFLEVFTQTCLWRESEGDFRMAFSQNVESKTLGCIGGVYGTIRWISTGIQQAEVFNFLITNMKQNLGAKTQTILQSQAQSLRFSAGSTRSSAPISQTFTRVCPARSATRARLTAPSVLTKASS